MFYSLVICCLPPSRPIFPMLKQIYSGLGSFIDELIKRKKNKEKCKKRSEITPETRNRFVRLFIVNRF